MRNGIFQVASNLVGWSGERSSAKRFSTYKGCIVWKIPLFPTHEMAIKQCFEAASDTDVLWWGHQVPAVVPPCQCRKGKDFGSSALFEPVNEGRFLV
jgi:hypothetical protein